MDFIENLHYVLTMMKNFFLMAFLLVTFVLPQARAASPGAFNLFIYTIVDQDSGETKFHTFSSPYYRFSSSKTKVPQFIEIRPDAGSEIGWKLDLRKAAFTTLGKSESACSGSVSHVRILESKYNSLGRLKHFAADFEQVCANPSRKLYGAIRMESHIPVYVY